MSDDTTPKKNPSVLILLLSAGLTLYFLWILLFAGGERPSMTLAVMYWLLVVFNLIFLGMSLARWRK